MSAISIHEVIDSALSGMVRAQKVSERLTGEYWLWEANESLASILIDFFDRRTWL
jgi:hypothetical protein